MTAPDATAGDGLRSDEWWTQLFLSAERAANEVPYSAGVAYPHPHAAAFRSAVEPALRDVLAAAARDAEKVIDAGHLRHQREWSLATFGPGPRTAGVSDHIRKELIEVRDAETVEESRKEWIDVVILALDGAWRSGLEPAEIIAAVKAKQARNEARMWPDWRTADPDKAIEHDRALDVP